MGHHQRPGSLPPALHTPALQGGVGEGDAASQPSPCSDCPILSPFHVPMDAAASPVLEASATPPRHGPGVGAGAGAGVAGLALESQSPRGAVPLPGPPALGSPSESHCPSPRRSTTPSTPRAVFAATMQQPQARVSAVGSTMGVGGVTGAGGGGNASPRTVDQAQPRGSAASTAAANSDRINSLGVFFKPVKPKRAASRVQVQEETPTHTQDLVNGSVPAPEDQQTGGASLVVHIAAAIVQRTYRHYRIRILARRFRVCTQQRAALLRHSSPFVAASRLLATGSLASPRGHRYSGRALAVPLLFLALVAGTAVVCAPCTHNQLHEWLVATAVAVALLLMVLQPARGVLVWFARDRCVGEHPTRPEARVPLEVEAGSPLLQALALRGAHKDASPARMQSYLPTSA